MGGLFSDFEAHRDAPRRCVIQTLQGAQRAPPESEGGEGDALDHL